jgi:hypothetical protein
MSQLPSIVPRWLVADRAASRSKFGWCLLRDGEGLALFISFERVVQLSTLAGVIDFISQNNLALYNGQIT